MSPFFIFYDARSGSNFLSKLLVEECGFIIPPEAGFVSGTLKIKLSKFSLLNLIAFIKNFKKDFKFFDWKINRIKLFFKMLLFKYHSHKSLIDRFILTFYKIKKIKSKNISLFGFKKGSYLWDVDLIMNVLPDTKIIYLIRDGRAVFASKKVSLHSLTKLPFETDPIKAAEKWKKSIDKYEYIAKNFPNNIFLIKYEDIFDKKEDILIKIKKFLLNKDVAAEKKIKYIVPERYKD